MGRQAGLGNPHHLTIALEDSHLTAQASQVRHKLLHVEQQAGVIWGDRGQREKYYQERETACERYKVGKVVEITRKK